MSTSEVQGMCCHSEYYNVKLLCTFPLRMAPNKVPYDIQCSIRRYSKESNAVNIKSLNISSLQGELSSFVILQLSLYRNLKIQRFFTILGSCLLMYLRQVSKG